MLFPSFSSARLGASQTTNRDWQMSSEWIPGWGERRGRRERKVANKHHCRAGAVTVDRGPGLFKVALQALTSTDQQTVSVSRSAIHHQKEEEEASAGADWKMMIDNGRCFVDKNLLVPPSSAVACCEDDNLISDDDVSTCSSRKAGSLEIHSLLHETRKKEHK